MKVFVGHSFKPNDAEVVSKIKDFITSYGFECITGEKSQNISISQKVQERIRQCDVFIGIFTKEKKINNGLLKPSTYTTSAWVIQESGFALAECSEIIFLFEENLDSYLGLQADMEYILFDRNKSLEQVFKKLMEMFKRIENKNCTDVVSSEKIQESLEVTKLNKNQQKNDDSEQEDVDEKSKLINNMYYAGAIENQDLLVDSYNKIKSLLSDDTEKLHVEALYLANMQKFGKTDSISELIKLVEEHPEDTILLSHLADYYQRINELEKTKDIYTKIYEIYKKDSDNSNNEIYSYFRIQSCIAKSGCYNEAIENLLKYLNAQDLEGKKILLKQMSHLALEHNDTEHFVIFSEYFLSLVPENTDIRFDLALKYSNNNSNKLSFLHYKKLIMGGKNTAALNNIALLYDKFNLEPQCVSCFEEAIEDKETLAMSNLANKYMRAGFIKNAKELLNKAISLAQEGIQIHGNIGTSQNELKNKIKYSTESEDKIFADANTENSFIAQYAKNYCTQIELDYKKMSGLWKNHFYESELIFDTPNFAFEFKTDIKNDKEYTLNTLKGRITNYTFTYDLSKKKIDTSQGSTILRGLLGTNNIENYSGRAIIADDCNSIKILEKDSNDNIAYYNWEKISGIKN